MSFLEVDFQAQTNYHRALISPAALQAAPIFTMRPGPSPILVFRARHPRLFAQHPNSRHGHRQNSSFYPNPQSLSIWQRLQPAVPTVLAWTIITSLAAQILNARHKLIDTEKQVAYQLNVLRSLCRRVVEQGEELSDLEIRRELELAGLRERRVLPLKKGLERDGMEGRKVGWKEALLGRNKRSEEETRRELEECELLKSLVDISIGSFADHRLCLSSLSLQCSLVFQVIHIGTIQQILYHSVEHSCDERSDNRCLTPWMP